MGAIGEIYSGEFTMNNVGTTSNNVGAQEPDASKAFGITSICGSPGPSWIETTSKRQGQLAQPVAHQVVHRGHHNPPTLGHRDRLCSIAELAAFARLDFDEHQRRAVARDDVYFGTAVPVAPGKNFMPSPRQLRAREILADLTETLPRLRHRPRFTRKLHAGLQINAEHAEHAELNSSAISAVSAFNAFPPLP